MASSIASSAYGLDDDGTSTFEHMMASSRRQYHRYRGRSGNGYGILSGTAEEEEEEEEGVDEIMNKPNVKAALGVGAAATLGGECRPVWLSFSCVCPSASACECECDCECHIT